MCQLRALVFLNWQGIAVRGHIESEGNLQKLLKMCSKEDDILKRWIKENQYTSHQAVNELMEIMGNTVLRCVLKQITDITGPAWFGVIADEVGNVVSTEQLNVSIRWVNDNYEVDEDPIGLCRVPNTKADTLFILIKDLFIWCNLPSLC